MPKTGKRVRGKYVKIKSIYQTNPLSQWRKEKGFGSVAVLECGHAMLGYESEFKRGPSVVCQICKPVVVAKAKPVVVRAARGGHDQIRDRMLDMMQLVISRLDGLQSRVEQVEDIKTAPHAGHNEMGISP